MVMKAGASNSDKVRIRKLDQGGATVEQISATCSIRIPQVQAILKQAREGVMFKGGTGYGLGDQDGRDSVPEQNVAAHMVNEDAEQRIAAMAAKLEAKESELSEEKDRADTAESLLDEATEE